MKNVEYSIKIAFCHNLNSTAIPCYGLFLGMIA